VDCPGYKEIRNIWERFAKGRRYLALRDPSSNPQKELRVVPNKEWPILLKTFLSCKPSPQMIESFLRINGLEKADYIV
jgi:hypothetical protein